MGARKITVGSPGNRWCSGWPLLGLAVWAACAGAQTNMPIYSDSLQNGWQDWSWASCSNTTRFTHSGGAALAVTAEAWEAAYFHHDPLDGRTFTNLAFWIHGGSGGGQRLLVRALLSGVAQSPTNLPPLTANNWQPFVIPLASLGIAGAQDFDGLWVQDRSGGAQPTFYLDDLTLIGGTPPPPVTNSLLITVDAARDRHPISDLIYGVAFASSNQLAELNCPLNRSGGNSESRYNWQLNAHNHAADWYFESLADSSSTPGAAGDDFVARTRAAGAEPMLTIPMVGWVPRLGAGRARLSSYSIAKYGAQTDSDWEWFPDAGNGIRSADGQVITGNDPGDANAPADSAFQRGWIQHLTHRWGQAARGGVRYYLMDNEPGLWHSTHRDVHPTGATMREVRDRFFDYAAMVKGLDPDALVAAPEEWGWSGYFWSGYDQQAGATNGWSHFPDRSANGGWDFLPWFLDQARQRAENTGQRLLDCFTVHYYPQSGEYSETTSAALQLLRNRSTRSLWDTNYTDASWIGDRVMLVPRLKNWVAAHYPGTRVGITEYSWGADHHINGATAQADILGILGREGVDLATRWVVPDTGSPAYHAIQMYRNYDGRKSVFGGTSVAAGGSDPDQLAVFAAVRSQDGALTVMAVHKDLSSQGVVTLGVTNFASTGAVQVWQLTASNVITRLPDAGLTGGTLSQRLPPQSITLFVVPALNALCLRTCGVPASNRIDFVVEGQAGLRYAVQQTTDLASWQPLFTNTLSSNSCPFTRLITNAPRGFYRAVTVP